MTVPLEVFCCYAREDQKMLEELKKHLRPLERASLITIWSDTNINAGAEWEKEHDKRLKSADIILLLISHEFMASDYCYSAEMKPAMARHHEGSAQVIPVLLSPAFWQNADFQKLQMVPKNARNVAHWPNPNDAFLDITEQINEVVSAINSQRETVPITNGPASHGTSYSISTPTAQIPPETPNQRQITRPNNWSDPNDAFLALIEQLMQKKTGSIPIPQLIQNPDEKPPVVPEHNDPSRDNPTISTDSPETINQVHIESEVLPDKPHTHHRKKGVVWIISIIALISLLAGYFIGKLFLNPPLVPISQQSITLGDGENITIGISDGSYPFITPQAMNEYNWPSTANGETCIYAADNKIGTDSYATVTAVVSLSETSADKYSLGLGNATLQGFCQEQMAYNQKHTVKLRILVTNIGVQEVDDLQRTMNPITNRLLLLAQQDKTFIGAVGFTFSASLDDHNNGYKIDTMNQLKQAGIPVISTAAATASFDKKWIGYFYRMNPGNDTEANVAARFAYIEQHKKTALVFYDSHSPYSLSLGTNFFNDFRQLAGTTKAILLVDIKDTGFLIPLQKLNSQPTLPDMIFCACVASSDSPDFSLFSQDLLGFPRLNGGKVMLMGADGLYNPEGLGITYQNMFFTALAFPDMISQNCGDNSREQCSSDQMNFYKSYCQQFATDIFNAPSQPPNETLSSKCGAYGVSRPSKSTMLAYDALSTLLHAYDPSSAPSLDKIRQALPKVAFQGITGWIQFSNTSNPVNKTIVVISVDGNGDGSIQDYCGEFTPEVFKYDLDPQHIC